MASGICVSRTVSGCAVGDDDEELAARSPPEIRLRGPATITLLAASSAKPYALCPPNAPLDLVCDPGIASAVDEVEGDLHSIGLVTACGPSSYLTVIGLAGCTHVKLDTPGTYTVSFAVSNSEVCPGPWSAGVSFRRRQVQRSGGSDCGRGSADTASGRLEFISETVKALTGCGW